MPNSTEPPADILEPGVALRVQRSRRVFITNFRAQISIGVYEHEKQAKQPVIISVDLYLDPHARIQRDSIRETVDYDFLRTEILRLADSGHFHLLETFGERILGICLDKAGVLGARVCCKKPDVYTDCDAVGFEIFGVK